MGNGCCIKDEFDLLGYKSEYKVDILNDSFTNQPDNQITKQNQNEYIDNIFSNHKGQNLNNSKHYYVFYIYVIFFNFFLIKLFEISEDVLLSSSKSLKNICL